MRIAFSGAASTGKTTTVTSFLNKWSQYKLPSPSYRTLITENKHSKKTDSKLQRAILDFMLKQQEQYTAHDKVVYDRCPLDNFVYTLWSYEKNKKGFTEKYINEAISTVRKSMRSLDIIFLILRDDYIPIEDNGNRESDPVYISETNNIFKAINSQYKSGNSPLFPPNDSPAIIEISGTTTERIEQIGLYVTEDGDMYGEEKSLVNIDQINKMKSLIDEQQQALQKEKGIL